jgi:hypothetical protein
MARAASPEAEADVPAAEAWLGRAVRREFACAGWCEGVVAFTRLLRPCATRVWLVCYAADGDTEELEWHELAAALLPAPPRAPRPARAPEAPLAGAPRGPGAAFAPRAPAARAGFGGSKLGPDRFRGVRKANQAGHRYTAQFWSREKQRLEHVGTFDSAEAAALAYDNFARARGVPESRLNFPDEDGGGGADADCADEEQQWGDAARALAAQPRAPAAHVGFGGRFGGRKLSLRRFHGVSKPGRRFAAYFWDRANKRSVYCGMHNSAQQAARAYDAGVRAAGLHALPLNFPDDGGSVGDGGGGDDDGGSDDDDDDDDDGGGGGGGGGDDAAGGADMEEDGGDAAHTLHVPPRQRVLARGCYKASRRAARRFRGVWSPRAGRFVARLHATYARRPVHIGTFDSAEAAARAWDAAARAAGVPTSRLNFPGDAADGAEEEGAEEGGCGSGAAGGSASDGVAAGDAAGNADERAPAADYADSPLPSLAPRPSHGQALTLDAFVHRRCVPPLRAPRAALAAMRRAGATPQALLRLAATLADAAVADGAAERALRAACTAWGLTAPADRLSLRMALAQLQVLR